MLLAVGLVIGILSGIGIAMVCKSNAQMRSLQETMLQVSTQESEGKEAEQTQEKAEQEEDSLSVQTDRTPAATEPIQEKTTENPEGQAGTEQNGQTVSQEVTEKPTNIREVQKGNTKEKAGKKTTSQSKSQTKQHIKSQTKTSTQSSKTSDCWYLVKKGDTLSEIVWRQYRDKKYISIVKQVNRIEDENEIKAGDRLRLPAR